MTSGGYYPPFSSTQPFPEGGVPSGISPGASGSSSSVSSAQGVRDQVPVSIGGYANAENALQATQGTSRVPFYTTCACTNLRLVYPGWLAVTSGPDTDYATALSINASIEIAGVIYRVTFGGQVTGVVQGGLLISDPIAIAVPAGQLIYVRTFPTTANWYPARYGNPGAGGQGGFTVTVDLTAPGSAAIADATTFTPLLAPAELLGLPTGAAYPATAALYGDSIAYGQGDGIANGMGVNTVNIQLGGGGYLARGLRALGVGAVNCGVQGDTLGNFVTAASYRRLGLITQARTIIFEYGRNDVSNLVALATIQANMITAWGFANKLFDAVFQTTITPRPNSSDAYQTLVNQTLVVAAEAIRVPLNNWLRAGAPIVNGAPAAIGAAGASIAGQAAHPLSGIIDPCAQVESALNSGLWNAGLNSRTVNDGVTVVGSTVTSATMATSIPIDTGRTIIIPGAGAAGGLYVGTIGRVFNGTSVSVLPACSTAIVAGAQITIVDTFTEDGTHPTWYAATQAAAALLPVASLLK